MTPTNDDILEFWNERAAIIQHDGGFPRDQSEIIARYQTSRHFGFDCVGIIQTERRRMAKVALLASIPGVRTGQQMAESR